MDFTTEEANFLENCIHEVNDNFLRYCKRLGWAALPYHKQKGAAPDPGSHKHCLQNDEKPDVKPDDRLGVRVGT